jgi:phosphoribosylformylglycinamidine cyclo-ligase
VNGILELTKHFSIKGLSHITGGGFIENIPRMLPQGLTAEIKRDSWPINPIFHLLKEAGQMQEQSLYNTFNMGIGMVLACESQDEQEILASLKESGYPAYSIGKVIEGQEGMVLR